MFAGIYTPAPTSTTVHVAIVTEPASDHLRHTHDRQPVLIDSSCLNTWLNPMIQNTDQLKDRISRTDSERLDCWPVSTAVNNPGDNSPGLITRIEHGAYSIIDTLDLKTVPLCHNKAYAKKVAAMLGLKSWRYVKIG